MWCENDIITLIQLQYVHESWQTKGFDLHFFLHFEAMNQPKNSFLTFFLLWIFSQSHYYSFSLWTTIRFYSYTFYFRRQRCLLRSCYCWFWLSNVSFQMQIHWMEEELMSRHFLVLRRVMNHSSFKRVLPLGDVCNLSMEVQLNCFVLVTSWNMVS